MKTAILLFLYLCYFHNAGLSQNSPVATNDTSVISLADPTIFPYKGVYYLYGTVEGNADNGFQVYHSRDLKNWRLATNNNGYALERGLAFGSVGFWAPQVFVSNGKFYMAYVANEQIAIAQSDSPEGPFTQVVKQPLEAPVKQIDPFIFVDDDGKTYLYHVRLTGGNKIFVAQMTDDFSAIVPQTLRECIAATEPWENTEQTSWPVAEGPSVLKRNGVYYLFYTANEFRNPDYAVGYATSNHPLGPWKKFEGNPILNKNMIGINGTGHGDFFNKGKELFYVFHTHYSNNNVRPRKSALIKVKFQKTGTGPDKLLMDKASFYTLKK